MYIFMNPEDSVRMAVGVNISFTWQVINSYYVNFVRLKKSGIQSTDSQRTRHFVIIWTKFNFI